MTSTTGRSWWHSAVGLFLTLLIAMMAGCSAAPTVPLRVGLIPWLGYEPLNLAASLGYVGPQAMRVVSFSSSTQTLRAFHDGSIDAAGLTLDETLLVAEDLPDVRAVLVMDVSNGADVVLGGPGVTTLADLRGRRVGYEATALGAYMLARALESAGLRVEDVTPVSVQFDEHEKALADKAVDAVVTFEPARSRLLATGAHELFSSARIPGEIADLLVVRGAFLTEHPEAVDAAVSAWFKVQTYRRQSPDDASRRLGALLRLTPDPVREAYRLLNLPDLAENRRLLGGEVPALRPIAARLGATMLAKRILLAPPRLDLFSAGSVNRFEPLR